MGRSGTEFLATKLHAAHSFTVRHEPCGSSDWTIHPHKLQDRFDLTNNYGEVNSYVRHTARFLRDVKFGVIVRNPADVWCSIMNRKQHHTTMSFYIEQYHQASLSMAHLIKNCSAVRIDFSKMTTDGVYLSSIVREFTGETLDFSGKLSPENATSRKRRRYTSLDQFPTQVSDRILLIERVLNS